MPRYVVTRKKEDKRLQRLAASVDLSNEVNVVAIIGGDGTVHEVVNGLMNRADHAVDRTSLAILPGGTGNTVALTLGIHTMEEALDCLVEGYRLRADVARLSSRADGQVMYACNVAGFGLTSDVVERAEGFRWAGGLRYYVAAVLEIMTPRKRPSRITFDGQPLNEGQPVPLVMFVMLITVYTGNEMKMAPRAMMDDGLMDIVFMYREPSRLDLLSFLGKLGDGSHLDDPSVDYLQCKEFTVECVEEEMVVIDGEPDRLRTPVDVRVIPRAVEYVVKRDTAKDVFLRARE